MQALQCKVAESVREWVPVLAVDAAKHAVVTLTESEGSFPWHLADEQGKGRGLRGAVEGAHTEALAAIEAGRQAQISATECRDSLSRVGEVASAARSAAEKASAQLEATTRTSIHAGRSFRTEMAAEITEMTEELKACQAACDHLQGGQHENGRLHAMLDRDLHRLKGVVEQRYKLLTGEMEDVSRCVEQSRSELRERNSLLAADFKSHTEISSELAAAVEQAQSASRQADRAHSEAQRVVAILADSQQEVNSTTRDAVALTGRVTRLEEMVQETVADWRAKINAVVADVETSSTAMRARAHAEGELRMLVEDVGYRVAAQRTAIESVQAQVSSVELLREELVQQVDFSKDQSIVLEMLRQRVDELQEKVGEQVSIWRKSQERFAEISAAHHREENYTSDSAAATPRSTAVDGKKELSPFAPGERVHPALESRRISFAPGVAPPLRSEIRREARASVTGGAAPARTETAGRRKTISSVAMRLSAGQT
mmetsp:Transcript_60595/g.162545  ORF Transcript_60595/g.162545 Transcript_60595/m.162545 type:complete len:487 (-) Transcript_60595:93-1553(-)